MRNSIKKYIFLVLKNYRAKDDQYWSKNDYLIIIEIN